MLFLLVFIHILAYVHAKATYAKTLTAVPVVMWHGMGDVCCNPMSLGRVQKLIEEKVPGIYVKSLKLGENIASDMERGFVGNMNEIVELACKLISDDPKLQQGYNAIGFSQGGLFLRAVAERCPSPPMRNYVSVGGPQQGIYGAPFCIGDSFMCNRLRRMIEFGAYEPLIQQRIVQAQYWHDPTDEQAYKDKNIFLSDINNEKLFHPDYKKNLLNLKNMVLVKFLKDTMVVPKDSEWFGFFSKDSTSHVIPMNETRLYKEDLIGLRKLEESGRIKYIAIDADHLRMSEKEIEEEIINKYFK